MRSSYRMPVRMTRTSAKMKNENDTKEANGMNGNVKTDTDPKACPVNDKWLRKMYEIFPPYIIRNSKLAGYQHCFEKSE